MLSLTLRRLSPHRISTTSRSWSCYFSSVSATKTPSEEDLVASFSKWNCIGSSHGWLGYVQPEDHSTFYLFKPSLVNHPSYLPFISLPRLRWCMPAEISKMIFSSSPTPTQRHSRDNDSNNASVLAVLTLNWGRAAAFCRMGDPEWTMSSNLPVSQMPMMKSGNSLCSNKSFQDIAYDSKHDLFYVITNSGEIYSWDLSNYRYCSLKPLQLQECSFRHLIKPPTTEFPPPSNLSTLTKHLDQGIKYYLVMDESSGALLLIRLLIYYTNHSEHKNSNTWDLPGEKSYIYDMHSLNVGNKLELEWFRVKGLVDTALFIGRNNGVVVDARQVPGLVTPGCIYLACNAFGFFQLTALSFSSYGESSHSKDSISILRADPKLDPREQDAINSFPVWNFE